MTVTDKTRLILNECSLPDVTVRGMERYLDEGTAPGSFLRAVLENDFMTAALTASQLDNHNFKNLGTMLSLLPPRAWGSKEKVDAWCDGGGMTTLHDADGSTDDGE